MPSNEAIHMNLKSLALAPLGSLYGAAIKARCALYRSGRFRSHELGAPVISVGNLTTGGTGKTPLTGWIARQLAQQGRRVCILTRGYKRLEPATRVVVSDGIEILADANRAGDEALMLAERLKGRAAVICDADRVSAAVWARENLESDAFVLDDGFQHLRVARDLNILTVDATNPWGNGRLFPAGILRELPAALARADCVVITRADDSDQTEELRRRINELSGGRLILRSRMTLSGLRPVGGREFPIGADKVKSLRVAAFCGVGNPQSFFSLAQSCFSLAQSCFSLDRRAGYQLCHTQAFRDHHSYTQNDIDRVVRESIERGAQVLLTTAKDEVKLRALSFEIPCYAADIEIEIENEERLIALIDRAVARASRP
jgi:tetraacyldisaccharide 4'-kinase